MATIRITIDTGNAAFEDFGGSEVARILRKLADRYDDEGLHVFAALHDVNGNKVGETELLDDSGGE